MGIDCCVRESCRASYFSGSRPGNAFVAQQLRSRFQYPRPGVSFHCHAVIVHCSCPRLPFRTNSESLTQMLFESKLNLQTEAADHPCAPSSNLTCLLLLSARLEVKSRCLPNFPFLNGS